MIRHFVQDLGISRVAIFYQYDEFGFDGLTGAEIALREHRVEAGSHSILYPAEVWTWRKQPIQSAARTPKPWS